MNQLTEDNLKVQKSSTAQPSEPIENKEAQQSPNEKPPEAVKSSTNELEEEDLLDEKILAALLGCEEKEVSLPHESISSDEGEELAIENPSNTLAQENYFDDPHAGKTKLTLSGNPFAKGGVVGLGFFVLFGAGALYFTQFTRTKTPSIPTSAKENQPTEPIETESVTSNQEEEIGVLKTQMALDSQEKQIKAIEELRSPKTKIETVKRVPEQPDPTPAPQRVVSSAPPPRPVTRPVTRPAPHPVPRAVPRPAPPVAQSAPAFSRPVAAPTSPPQPQPTVVSNPIDPMEQWRLLSSLGSYGSSLKIEEVEEPAAAEVEEVEFVQQYRASSPVASLQMPRAMPVASKWEAAEAQVNPQVYPQVNPAEEANILKGTPIQRLQVGQQVPAQLVTPIIWAGDMNSDSSELDERFVVELEKPLTDEQGQELLAAGTPVVFVCRWVHESGLVRSSAIALIKDGTEYALPPGVISIRGHDGNPLMADKWDDTGSEIARRDRTAFLFGALSQVGEVLNRPDIEQSTSSTSSFFSQTTTTRSGDPNILGAVLEGGFTPLAEQILRRNEQATQKLLNRPELWYVRAGDSVQVFVNQSFEL
ncbi:MAG: TrbI/VirB10 family protein [Symploca sp. SIO1C4]|uniref:TrbI/VirB10 family protein n=1 Tax=Symploca sp. SIO1C4 TaxID=2607765 RepID=A0A6B3N9Q5_9CYAN|nr:TrbI/VirB10 family protein [Symploca sp. SIO1C4]